jgi:hypothetical protein
MKTLFSLLLSSVALMAQKKENLLPIPKTDTVKTAGKGKFPGYFTLKSDQSLTELYKS